MTYVQNCPFTFNVGIFFHFILDVGCSFEIQVVCRQNLQRKTASFVLNVIDDTSTVIQNSCLSPSLFHDKVKSTFYVFEALQSAFIGNVAILSSIPGEESLHFYRIENCKSRDRSICIKCVCVCRGVHEDEVAEWLRRWTANPLGSARVGSNPILVVYFFLFFVFFQ